MKLLNQSIKYATLPMLLIVSIWALMFYFSIYREIKGSVDEGLDNYKRQIVYQVSFDTILLHKKNFDKGFYAIRSIDADVAMKYKDKYKDTLMLMQDADDPIPELEPARLLTTAFELNGKYYELKVINSMIEADDLIKQLFINVLWLLLLLFITLAFINNFSTKRLWKPFYTMLSKLKVYKLGNKDQPISIKTDTTEFKDLQQAVNTLLKQNNAIFEQQKQFIGNASHELQTPLAVIINKLELLAEDGNLNDGQARNVAEIIQTVNRLIRMNKSFLLLSKIENYQFSEQSQISINELIKQEIEELDDIVSIKDITITLKEDAEVVLIMNASLAQIVVSNLLRNALFHNRQGGLITIHIEENKLIICNTGKNEPLDNATIFLRFQGSTDNKENSGLGLAIVKAICDLNNHAITYNFTENLHCFQLIFKN